MSLQEFSLAKQETVATIQAAIQNAREVTSLEKYREMLREAERIKHWQRLMGFIFYEKLARENLKVL